MRRYRKLSAAVFLCNAIFLLPATPQPSNSTTTNENQQVASTKLQGSVKVIELNLELLKEIGLDIKNVIKSASSVYDEVNIRPVQIMTQPEVVGRGMVINIPVGTRPTGPPAPPRQKRLDRAMNQIVPVIGSLKQDVDDVRAGHTEIAVSDTVAAQLKPLFREWGLTVDNMGGQLTALQQLTAGPAYDNSAISARASSIVTDAERLDKTRRKIYKVLQEEGKKSKK